MLDHLLSVVHSETPLEQRTISILDVGCGDGQLIAFLYQMLARYRPGVELSIRGFDVSDSSIQVGGFFDETLRRLSREIPEVDWTSRLALLTSTQAWPYENESFDWVVSNHVLEHVGDHELVFREIHRVLKTHGKSVHLFPARDNVIEPHVHIPGAHWFRDHDRMRGHLRAMTRLGIGTYRERRREDPTLDVERFAESRADYILYFTNYLTKAESLALAKKVGLRGTYRYTEHFLFTKLRRVFRMPPAHRIRPLRIPVLRMLLSALVSRVTSVTLLLEKKQTYRP